MRHLFLTALLLTAPMAQADISARFIESAPKDRFVLTNLSGCPEGAVEIRIDLAGSAAGLIFDTTGSGAGVDVFQPFELVRGAELVRDPPQVRDGQTEVILSLTSLPAGAEIAFTVDVDDTRAVSDLGQTRVSGAEIAGARLEIDGQSAPFGPDAIARLPRAVCNA